MEEKPALSPTPEPIAFIDLQAQRARIAGRVDAAIAKVLAHGAFILGPEVAELESHLAAYVGARHAITCSSGTDAILLALLAHGVRPGDAVFMPAFGFVAAAEMTALIGASPVFVDVDPESFNLDPASLAAAIEEQHSGSLRPAAILAIDLYGQAADYPTLSKLAEREGLALIEDAAQSFGGTLDGKKCGTLAPIATTSFYPTKPLGCYGDGGAVFTDDAALAQIMGRLRVHGEGKDKYLFKEVGINGRMDTIQAAVLLEKMTIFDDELARRQKVADRYEAVLGDLVETPKLMPGNGSAWAQYTIQVDDRDGFAKKLRADGVPTAVHYPVALNDVAPYANYPTAPDGAPVSRRLAKRVISLPMHPYLEAPAQDRILAAIRKALS
ncbi:MAG: DegT/DnrJ/EryC1/StrS aminotransferase family protein [Alphaproteobacteria bacterium]|nr:DegT/DnrJ/EryC1/StrS aminotransferase family protein [Alphaproteobacteria bacterium]